MSGPGFTRPDLCSICAAAEQAGFAVAVRGLLSADGYPLAEDDPLASWRVMSPVLSSRRASRGTTATGTTCCAGSAGVCLMPILAESDTSRSAIAVSRTTHDLLRDWDWRATYSHTCQLMNAVPGRVLHAFGYLDRQFGTGAACLVTSHRGQRTEAGR